MPHLLYDFIDGGGANPVLQWLKGLQKADLGKLNAKLDMLIQHGSGLRPQTLAGTDMPGISKIRVHGKVQLRPLLCEGPIAVGDEFTLLCGATEIGSKLYPKGVLDTASTRKQQVIASPDTRRVQHVRP